MDRNEAASVIQRFLTCRDICRDDCCGHCETCRYNTEYDEKTEALQLAIKALEQAPKWIPVSERLPETEEAYTDCIGFENGDLSKPISPLTCYESGPVLAYGILDEGSEGRQIFVATYDEWKHHETGKIETGWKDNVCGDDCKVFAWMPLPEPWKGE